MTTSAVIVITSLDGKDLKIAAHWLALVKNVLGRPPDLIGDLVGLFTQLKEVTEATSGSKPDAFEVVSLRYGLDGDKPMTLQEIAMKFGYTRERIRHVEERVLHRLRYPRYSIPLRAAFYMKHEAEPLGRPHPFVEGRSRLS